MECDETRALKSSFLSEIATKSSQPVFFDDLWCVTEINSVTCDDFSVDDLLDLSDKEFKDGSSGESEEDEDKDSLSASDNDSLNTSMSTAAADFGPLPAGELAVPVDDWENLEWLSQFVDDSVTEHFLLCPAGNLKEKTSKCSGNLTGPVAKPAVQNFSVLCLPSPVPTKARSKRSRPSGRVWSVGSFSLTESFSTSSSSIQSSLTSPLMLTTQIHSIDSFCTVEKPPVKKRKRNRTVETGSGTGGPQTQRRCSHCHVQKTPQWRTGPLGPKTLCNACGVRYKSGRLCPEYRPACSPTFSGDLHSNSHRKVMEMRRKKEMVELVESGLTPIDASDNLRLRLGLNGTRFVI